jgi:hypothetical protein
MKVYRFVNPQGNGIYQDDFFTQIGLTYIGEDIPFYQPPLYEDVRGFKWHDLNKYCCAFESPYQIVSWFRDINPLDIFIEGGQLYEFDVDIDTVLRGRCQCIFMKANFNEKRLVSVDEFIDLIDQVSQKMDSLISW